MENATGGGCWIRQLRKPALVYPLNHWSDDAKSVWESILNKYQTKIHAVQTQTSHNGEILHPIKQVVNPDSPEEDGKPNNDSASFQHIQAGGSQMRKPSINEGYDNASFKNMQQIRRLRSGLGNVGTPINDGRVTDLLPDKINKEGSLRMSRKFHAPYKRTAAHVDDNPKKYRQCDLRTFLSDAAATKTVHTSASINMGVENDKAHTEFVDDVVKSGEVLLTLQYADATYQLNTVTPISPASRLVMAYRRIVEQSEDPLSVHLDSTRPLHVTSLPLDDRQWVTTRVRAVMSSGVRKVCYGAAVIVTSLIRHFPIPHREVMEWRLIDVEVGAWLLDPDHPPPSLPHLISPHDKSSLQMYENSDDISLLMQRLSSQSRHVESALESRRMTCLFHNVEMRLVPIVSMMELCPLSVDVDLLVKISKILEKKLDKLEKEAHASAGHKFSLCSHHQLRQVLFDELKLDRQLVTGVDKTIVGRLKSTSEAVLTQLKETHSLPRIVSQHRQLQKLKSTYIDGMLGHVTDGMLSTHWDQTAAATGRLTSYHPNIQAIPKLPVSVSGYTDNDMGGMAAIDDTFAVYPRQAFISRQGSSLVSADYQQIELRMLSHLTDDPRLVASFTHPDSSDIFISLTSAWLGKARDEVTNSEREQTKRVVYSIMYGAGKEKLGEYLKIKPDQAKAVIDSFLGEFPAVRDFTKHCINYCQRHGHTSTVLNRQRKFPHIYHHSPVVRARTQRQAVNFCVQGSAADVCKVAMVEVVKALLTSHSHLETRLLVQIHDELLFEVPDSNVQQLKDLLKRTMEDRELVPGGGVTLRVPLTVSIKVGKNWAHMTEF